MSRLYAALVHHPVLDKQGQEVATAVTNLDVHDLARLARTYGLGAAYIVTPVEAQRRLVRGILDHWLEGPGRKRVPARAEAMARLRVVPDVATARAEVAAAEGRAPKVWATAARDVPGVDVVPGWGAWSEARAAGDPGLLLFGTGHGLAPGLVASCDGLLPPIRAGGYNHLSVRAAIAIAFDRLVGERGPESPADPWALPAPPRV
ncbi:MAG: RNA methyltransferase [Myxococcota bacterium]